MGTAAGARDRYKAANKRGLDLTQHVYAVLAASFAWAVFLELLEGDNAANKEWLVVDDFINYTGW